MGANMKENDKTYYYVCEKYCHPRKQWSPRKYCANKADYKKKMEEKWSNLTTRNKHSKDFKVALAAICSDNNYKFLESQFSE